MENIVIRKITCNEVESAMNLALEVFMQFEAPDYAPSGVDTFKRDIVENPEYLENARQGICPIYGAFDGDKIVALMGMRSSKTHINLVFTKKDYHRKGIARAIFHYLLNDILAEATARVQPPSDKGKRLRIYYMTQASTRPPTFVCFCNRAELFHFSYKRYQQLQIEPKFQV